MTPETYFHGAEVLILLLGIALPAWKNNSYLKSVLKNFPPHLHTNGDIIYPDGYEPPAIVKGKNHG